MVRAVMFESRMAVLDSTAQFCMSHVAVLISLYMKALVRTGICINAINAKMNMRRTVLLHHHYQSPVNFASPEFQPLRSILINDSNAVTIAKAAQ